jgi:hypothetical protein
VLPTTGVAKALCIPNFRHYCSWLQVFMDHICLVYGWPDELRHRRKHDRQSYDGKVPFTNIKRLLTTSYRPQTDGLIERFHATLKTNLPIYLNYTHDNRVKFIPSIVFAYNTVVALDSSPF